jgi:fatty-acyl-CoA synthase
VGAGYFATDAVAYHSRIRPDAPALSDVGGKALTWRDFEERVAGLAGALADDFGVGHGDRVAVLALNNSWVLVVQFACIRLGAIFVPLNYRLAQGELEFLCTDSAPKVLVHDMAHAEMALKVAGGAGVAGVAAFNCPDAPYDLAAGAAAATPRGVTTGPSRPKIGDTVQLIYTSGTTGRPKGAIIAHITMNYNTLNSIEPYELSAQSRYLAVLPFFHAGGLNSMAIPVLSLGGSVAVMPGFEPAEVVTRLSDAQQGFTHFSAAPVMYQVMSTMPEFAEADFSHMRHGQIGGGFLNWETLKAFHDRGLPLCTGYGSTEMGPIVSVVSRNDVLEKHGTCGAPVQYTAVRIVGPDGQDVAVGETGEVWAHGPSITPGYWGRNRDEDSAFEGEWFRSGDAVTQDSDGYLTLVDRFKDMYKSGGENVFPAEVERVLQAHPDIADAAVIPIPHQRWGEVGRALLIPKAGTDLDVEGLNSYCRSQLAGYKVPAEFLVVEPFDRNASGKLPKAELKKQYGPEAPTAGPALSPAEH